jgi:FKBP-type peptidyl-prolyl cis-trans isomerase FklB
LPLFAKHFKIKINMKRLVVCSFALLSVVSAVNAQTKKAPVKAPVKKAVAAAPVMKNLLDSFSYAAGLNIANNMKEQGISNVNPAMMQRAINDVFQNKPTLLTHEVASMKLQEQLAAFQQKKSAGEKAKGEAFLAENKKRKGVISLPNGLQYEVISAGEAGGAKPTAADTVVVHYAGTLIDGKPFDSSIERGEPATFPVGGVIRGWTEILQIMPKGAKWKVFIPSDLAYGDRGAGAAIPPGATLVFEINLLDIKPAAVK